MAISAKDVKRLRDITGVGMMDCKAALEEAGGNFDKAIELLRKKGQKVAAKRADRQANEGLIVTALSGDNKIGAMAEINCETDFVARNEDFAAFANQVVEVILRERPDTLEQLNDLPLNGGRTVGQSLVDLTGKIGEKIDVRRFAVLHSEGGRVVSYIHPGSRLGVLVDISGNSGLEEAGTDVAMQIAAMNPVATTPDEVPQELKQKELEIAREAALNEGKPEHIVDRIAQGKLERFFKDHVLLEQPFVKDSSMSVKEMLQTAGAGVSRFVRYALGE